jgi:thiosulfate reductase cytochrome b subunit
LFYLGYQVFSGNHRQVLFVPRDIRGVWPMARHYFFFGPKPADTETYNPLQKLAYTSAIILGVLSVWTGLVIWKPVQFSGLVSLLGGFQSARILHFLGMAVIFGFLVVHVVLALLVPRTLWAMLAGGPRVVPLGHGEKGSRP